MLALATLCALHSILRPSVLPAHLREEGGRQLQQRGPRLFRDRVRRIFFQPLHLVSRGEVVQPRVAIFMIGLPGAGKSRIIYDRYERHLSSRRERTTVVVDLDREMAMHPEYDPRDPDRLYLDAAQTAYKWADSRAEAHFASSLSNPKLRRLVIDGTGTNHQRQIRRMALARQQGWFVKALYVRVPAKTAILRAQLRGRGVKPSRIFDYQKKVGPRLRLRQPAPCATCHVPVLSRARVRHRFAVGRGYASGDRARGRGGDRRCDLR